MKTIFAAIVIGLAASVSSRADNPAIHEMQRLANQQWEIPGSSLIVVDRHGILFSESQGVRELEGKPLRSSTLFPLASCTKQFTSTIIASLIDDGLLEWNDPVRKYLPWFRLSDPATSELVSVKDLLCHRTGLPSHDLLWYRSPWTDEDIVRRCTQMQLTSPFRTELQYQSIMYMAAGLVCEKVSGKPWRELVEHRIFKKLGMKTASTVQPDATVTEIVSGHRSNADGQLKKIPLYEMKKPNSAGSIFASSDDLAVWLRFLLNEGAWNGQQLISAKNLRETWTPQTIIRKEGSAAVMNPHSKQLAYGLGWVIQDYQGHLLCQHAGFIDGIRVHLTLLPEDGLAFAILANREGTRMPLCLSNQLVDHLLKLPAKTDWNKLLKQVVAEEELAVKTTERQQEIARRGGTTPSLPLKSYVGQYEHAAYGTLEIAQTKSGLEWTWNGWKLPLSHWEVNTFRIDSDAPPIKGLFVSFGVADGQIKLARFNGLEFPVKLKP